MSSENNGKTDASPASQRSLAGSIQKSAPLLHTRSHNRVGPSESAPETKNLIGDTNPSYISRFERWRGMIGIVVGYVMTSTRKNQRSFAIGFVTVLMVVTILCLVTATLGLAPMVFLKLAEDFVGQFDLLIAPSFSLGGASTAISFLNHTRIKQLVEPLPIVSATSPRWILPANLTSELQPFRKQAFTVIFDTDNERAAGIGSTWPYRALGFSECHISAGLARSLLVRPNSGDFINLNIGLAASVSIPEGAIPQGQNFTLSDQQLDGIEQGFGIPRAVLVGNSQPDADGNYVISTGTAARAAIGSALNFTTTLSVIDVFDLSYGKYASQIFSNVVIVEQDAAQRAINAQVDNLRNNGLGPALNLPEDGILNIEDFAINSVIMKNDRITTYRKAKVDRQADMVDFSNQVLSALGLNFGATIVDNVSKALDLTDTLRIFMDEILFTMIFMLSLLAGILIYALLIADVEEKTFEFGMLRTLGLRQNDLLWLLLVQSLSFSVPATSLGLLISAFLSIPIRYAFTSFAGIKAAIEIDPYAFILATIIGLVLPVLGMLAPTRRALSKTLRDAIDKFRRNTGSSTSISIYHFEEETGVSIQEIIIAVLVTVFGFLVYYLIPFSFTLGNLGLFFRVLTIILLAMVIGQAFLSQAFQHLLEVFVLFIVVVARDRPLHDLVCKQVASHLPRNRKTNLIFTLCLANIIFAATLFRNQAYSLTENVEWTTGADIRVSAPSFEQPLPEESLRSTLNSTDSRAASFSFYSYPLNSFPLINNMRLYPLSSGFRPTVNVLAVDDNSLDTVLTKYYIPAELDNQFIDQSGGGNVLRALQRNSTIDRFVAGIDPIDPRSYNPAFDPPPDLGNIYENVTAIPFLGPANLPRTYYFSVDQLSFLRTRYVRSDSTSGFHYPLMKPAGFLTKFPGVQEIATLGFGDPTILIHPDRYSELVQTLTDITGERLSNSTDTSYPLVPKQHLLIRARGVNDVESIVNDVGATLGNYEAEISTVKEQTKATIAGGELINIAFIFVALVSLIISFFVLWISFTANVRQHAWEFGVLRAIGITCDACVRIYIYEALAVIMTSIICGTVIGVFTAVAISLTNILFSSQPFSLNFPLELYIPACLASIILAVVGSYYPTREISRKEIAIVLKSN